MPKSFHSAPMKKDLSATLSYTLKEEISEDNFVNFNVGPSGEVYVLLAVNTLDYRTENDGAASFAKIVPEKPQHYRVLVYRKGELELDVAIRGERFNIHEIQPLGNDLLLVCSRSEYRGRQDFDLNARVYSRDGVFIRAFLIGDGIQTIQATHQGEIWTSYFDEGVFGNFGWSDPVGAAGLVAWDALGAKTYEYDAIGAPDSIVDCYALNVAGAEDVWCYYYTDFPLVRIHQKRVASIWTVPVSGSGAFAVHRDHVLFAGGYGKRDELLLVRLAANGTSTLVDEFGLIGDDEMPVKLANTVGRGTTLYVFSEAVLYEIDLAQFSRQG
jgi:hypothetical protein